MSKKVLVIASSLRKGSNSDILADEFERGAIDAGHQVEKISLKDKTIGFCKGCLACQKTMRCVMHDDADMIAQKMYSADVVVFATPIYYYGLSGQLKTLLDRMNPLYPSDYAFREVYLLTTAAEDEETTMERAISGLQGWIDCFEKAELKGVIRGGGVNDPSEIQTATTLLSNTYKMGRHC